MEISISQILIGLLLGFIGGALYHVVLQWMRTRKVDRLSERWRREYERDRGKS